MTGEPMITPKQLGKLWGLLKETGRDRETAHQFLAFETARDIQSSKQLTRQEAGVKRNDPGYYHMDELDGLAALLRAHVGETVTAHQLKELGTHPRDLEKLFRAAATAGAAVSK